MCNITQNVLVIDDEENNLILVSDTLQNQSTKIILAKDGRTGINKAIEIVPDLILLDIMMPKMDGFKVFNELKKNSLTKYIPVIFLSAIIEQVKAFKLGAVDYIKKPFSQEELITRIGVRLELIKSKKALENEQKTKKETEQALIESEKKYHLLSKTMKDVVATISFSGKILYVSESIFKFAKITNGENIDNHISTYFANKKELLRALQILVNIKNNGNSGTFEFVFKSKNNEPFPVELTYTPLYEDKKVSAILVVLRNVTVRKQTEQALRKSEKRFRNLFTRVPVGIYRTGFDGKILDVNPELTKMLGFSNRQELLSKNINDIIVDANNRNEKINLLEHNKTLNNQLIQLKHKDNKIISTLDSTRCIKDIHNKLKYFEGSMVDITEQVKAEKALKDSERKYRLLTESLKDVVIQITPKGDVLYVSPTIKNFLSYDTDILKDGSIMSFFTNEKEKLKAIQIIQDINKNKQSGVFEFTYKPAKKLQDPFPVEVSYSPLVKNNEVESIQLVMRDISQHRQAVQDIIDSEEKYRILFEKSNDAILMIDKDKFVDCNKAAVKLFGYTKKSELIKKHPSEISPKLQEDGILSVEKANEMITLAYNKGVNKFEWIHKRANDENFPVEVWLTSIPYKDRHIIHAVCRDMTEYKKAKQELIIKNKKIISLNKKYKVQNEKLEITKQKANEANSLKSEFLANMSHEIRTPMNAIIGFANILQQEIKNEQQKDYVDKIVKSGNDLLNLINDILDLSKIEAGQIKIQKEANSLHNLFREIPNMFYHISEKKQIPINFEIDKNLPKLLLVDIFRIRQVLLNLVSNALKFTKKGDILIIAKTIENTKKSEKPLIDLMLKVIDTGIGIPNNQLEVIFNSFSQVEGQNSRIHGGTGLGLSITKQLVKLMNGTISVKSSIGVGSTFQIILKDVEIIDDYKKNEIIEKNNEVNVSFEKPKILHVEDIDLNREVIALFLKKHVNEIKEAETGKEALEILKTYTPDIILMDIHLPELDGFEATKIIKKDEKLKSIPVIAVTANATKKNIKEYSTVFDDIQTKPVNKKKLLKSIFELLGTKNDNSGFNEQYKKKVNEKKFKGCIEELQKFKSNNNDFPDDLKKILKELEPIYTQLLETLTVDDLKDFVMQISIISEKYNIDSLKTYAKKLNKSVNNFNLKKINTLLPYFTKFVKIIFE